MSNPSPAVSSHNDHISSDLTGECNNSIWLVVVTAYIQCTVRQLVPTNKTLQGKFNIRIAPENARLLFELIRADYKGAAPRCAYNRRTATMSNDGMLLHDPQGNLQLAQGYKVLVFIENFGGENVVAALF